MIETKKKFITGTYDFMFKELVCSSESRQWLCYMISDITGIDYDELYNNLKIKNPRLIVNNKKQKKSVTDVIVEINKTHLNLEMNKYFYEGLMEKNETYLALLKGQLSKEGIDYLDIGKIIQININSFNKINSPKLVNKFVMMDKDTGIIESASSIKYYVNLPILDKICYNKSVNELTRLEKSLLLLYSDDIELLERIGESEYYMKRVVDLLKKLNEDEVILGLYDLEEETKKIQRTKEHAIRLECEKEAKEAIEESHNKGLEKGKTENQIEIAINMLKKGLDVKLVSECTELDVEEVEKLKLTLDS